MSELPQPTEDLAQVKTQLDTYGYGLLANALNAEDLLQIKTRLKEQAIAEKQRGLAFEDGGAKQNWGNFRNKKGQVRGGGVYTICRRRKPARVDADQQRSGISRHALTLKGSQHRRSRTR